MVGHLPPIFLGDLIGRIFHYPEDSPRIVPLQPEPSPFGSADDGLMVGGLLSDGSLTDYI